MLIVTYEGEHNHSRLLSSQPAHHENFMDILQRRGGINNSKKSWISFKGEGEKKRLQKFYCQLFTYNFMFSYELLLYIIYHWWWELGRICCKINGISESYSAFWISLVLDTTRIFKAFLYRIWHKFPEFLYEGPKEFLNPFCTTYYS